MIEIGPNAKEVLLALIIAPCVAWVVVVYFKGFW
jgi:hypothetical protein